VNIVSESGLKPLEVWVAEDSPFYRLVVEEAIEEIAKVTDVPISLTVFERFGDIGQAFALAQRGGGKFPSAVLSDLHFPDCAHDDLQDILLFYSRYTHLLPVSYMSCNLESLELAEKMVAGRTDMVQKPRFLRKDTAETMSSLVKTIHSMLFTARTVVPLPLPLGVGAV
jgi:CheY-like chemotaxis protein